MRPVRYRHLIRDRRAERLAGYVALALGFYLLYGAYDRRGTPKPRLMGPLLPW